MLEGFQFEMDAAVSDLAQIWGGFHRRLSNKGADPPISLIRLFGHIHRYLSIPNFPPHFLRRGAFFLYAASGMHSQPGVPSRCR